jgi:hypothetical protein
LFPGKDNSTAGRTYISATLPISLTAGQYVGFQVRQESGSAKDLLYAEIQVELKSVIT